jgi:hypothetical protein
VSESAKPEVYLLTESDGFFGQRLMPWESMDVSVLKRILSESFSVTRATYAEIASGSICPKDSIIVHSSSQQPEYKEFIDDLLLYLHANDNWLVPSIHTTRSHENKGYQELHRRLCGIQSPNGHYVTKLSEVDLGAISYPVVLKDLSGYGSSGVRLVHSEDELLEATASERRLSWREAKHAIKATIGNFIRKHLMRRKNLRPYGDYYEPMKRFVLQDYIQGLSHDFKVLAFQDRIFLLKRDVRPSDFRASGSGRFRFDDPPAGLLSFAAELLGKFNEPYMSFDICFDGSLFHLIEFQGVHFGPFTLVESQKHFQRCDGRWEERFGNLGLEDVVGESLVLFIKRSCGATGILSGSGPQESRNRYAFRS